MKFLKYLSLIIIFNCFSFQLFSQNLDYAKKVVEDLSAPNFNGRGYYKKGVNKAGKYISNEMKDMGLQSFEKNFAQYLSYDVNVFSHNTYVELDGQKLVAGDEYFVGASSPKIKGDFNVVYFDSITYSDTSIFKEKTANLDLSSSFLTIDFSILKDSKIRWFYVNLIRNNTLNAVGYIERNSGSLSWSVRNYQDSYPTIKIQKDAFPDNVKTISIDIKPKLVTNYKTNNVIGYVPASAPTDEYIVFTAHYDHLGHMGKEMYIPGAQDNASGTAMVLDLARYYSQNPSKYNIAFMLFTGEEAGLYGSIYYVTHPYFPLKKIKTVINLDMVGTGDDGITIVNGKADGYEAIFSNMESINLRNEYFTILKARDESANSDHYPFHAMGTKAIFIYTMGGETYYHNPKDKPETLTFTGYVALFNLLTDFVHSYE
jgi:hypothetical protein